MNIKRPLIPGFLKRAEQKLLLNKPGIWSTRAHLVVYYGVLFILVLTALCFIEPNDPRDYSTTEAWIAFVSIISGVGLIIWLIYLLRFNVFKKYGNIHPLHGLVTFLLYFIATGILVSFSYVHPIVESVRANLAYDDKEVSNDINDINVKINQLEYSQMSTAWKYDTIELAYTTYPPVKAVNTDPDPVAVVDTVPSTQPGLTNSIPRYRLDSADFQSRITGADSLIKLTDSLYLAYTSPHYKYLSPYLYHSGDGVHLLSDFELFKKVYRHPPAAAERENIASELNKLLKKYEYVLYRNYATTEMEEDDTPLEIIEKKYRLGNVDSSISHIFQKKYRWQHNDWQDLIRIFYYVTLVISLLIFIFRHTTVRTFFLSVLAGVLITIFTALIAAFSRSEGLDILTCLIFYTFAFFCISLSVFGARKRRAIGGIAINLFTFLVVAFPICIMVWYHEYRQKQLYGEGYGYGNAFDLEKYIVYAEVGGTVLLLVLLSTYISKVYRLWYSLPEN